MRHWDAAQTAGSYEDCGLKLEFDLGNNDECVAMRGGFSEGTGEGEGGKGSVAGRRPGADDGY
jgi:hypothetical protein